MGRVTLYAHFASRAEVVDAAMSHAIARGNEVLDTVDLSGDPLLALARYIEAGWHLVDQARALLAAAQRELPAGRILELHAGPAARVEALVARGRAEGAFRTDLPIPWMVNVLHAVMHSAAEEIRAAVSPLTVPPTTSLPRCSPPSHPRAPRCPRPAAGRNADGMREELGTRGSVSHRTPASWRRPKPSGTGKWACSA
ncbi:hypothetical protein GCM10020295_81740 [Streptomyces cinereospinus]